MQCMDFASIAQNSLHNYYMLLSIIKQTSVVLALHVGTASTVFGWDFCRSDLYIQSYILNKTSSTELFLKCFLNFASSSLDILIKKVYLKRVLNNMAAETGIIS